MRAAVISLDDFFETIEESLAGLFPVAPYFSLILGAGASRSAGIPVASEMTRLLEELISSRGYPIEAADPKRVTFSEAIGTVVEYSNESDIREFILRCVRRGSREPNLTHLIAANLACCGFCQTIVTTNFDDLALAAFWEQPVNEIYQEPYVIYDPRTVQLSRVELGENVPVIIKAHGHHTQYGLGLLDQQIAAYAPGVKRAMRWQKAPQLGYLVVGSSGSFADGVIEGLKDRQVTRGRPIYWFFRGELPQQKPQPLAQLVKESDVRFVRCDDSDALFLRLWQVLDGTRGSAWLLDSNDLFTPPTTSAQIDANDGPPEAPWAFNPRSSPKGSRDEQRAALGVTALAKVVLPILGAIDNWDEELLPYDCLPEPLRERALHAPEVYFDGREPKQIEDLGQAVTRHLPWTRRNRKLLRTALDESTDPLLSYTLLTTIDRIRASRPRQP